MKPDMNLALYAVLDPNRARGRNPVDLAAAAARGGVTLMQLRDKRRGTRSMTELTRALLAALAPFRVPLLINDHVDVALATGVQGVHLGLEDMEPTEARRLLGPDALIGVTVHHPHEADAVDPALVDYVGLGPTYPTVSKRPDDPPVGPEGIARLVGRLRARLPGFPACAISGIDHANAPSVLAAGVDGVAVISDVFMAEDVEAAARRLRRVVDQALRERKTA